MKLDFDSRVMNVSLWAAVLACLIGTLALYHSASQSLDGVTARLARMQAEIGEANDAIRELDAPTPSLDVSEAGQGTSYTADESLADANWLQEIASSIEAIDARLFELETQFPRENSAETDPIKDRQDFIDRLTSNYNSSEEPKSLKQNFEEDTGYSDWGLATADNVQMAFSDTEFFQQHGGRIATDCRQNSCEVEWAPSYAMTAEDDFAFMTASRIELMSLIGQNTEDLGQLEVEYGVDGNSRTISVYFQREDY